ncbi:hypothetical protein ACIPYS_21005 [Kitasatospora sp. NPDC089913]|uniref:hypothetical protein n=1 Tax=Kitasatospora sp. NPDC089913 TaxID=3364080 RepID=UPI00380D4A5D
MDWSRWSVVLLKPDCVRGCPADQVLVRLEPTARIVHRQRVLVEDRQIHVHYRDLLVERDLFEVDVPACPRTTYVGQEVEVALVHADPGAPERLRDLYCVRPGRPVRAPPQRGGGGPGRMPVGSKHPSEATGPGACRPRTV